MRGDRIIFIMKTNPKCLDVDIDIEYGQEYIVSNESNVVLLPVNNSEFTGRIGMPLDQLVLNGICIVGNDMLHMAEK